MICVIHGNLLHFVWCLKLHCKEVTNFVVHVCGQEKTDSVLEHPGTAATFGTIPTV